MKIESYYMQASSEHTFYSMDKVQYSAGISKLPSIQPDEGDAKAANDGAKTPAYPAAVKFTPSEELRQSILNARATNQQSVSVRRNRTESAPGTSGQNKYEVMFSLLEELMRRITGGKYKVYKAVRAERPSQSNLQQNFPSSAAGGNLASNLTARVSTTQIDVSHYESESLLYNAQGFIKTADGQSISVNVSLNMSRSFSATFSQSFQTAQIVTDPLVINFSGNAASLTSTKYAFDLDVDGTLDQISFTGAGSGFLALDKNGDGRINDGTELFGPQSGSGFGELRTYDADGNGWIDENDDVFSRLRVWSKDEAGNDLLLSLKAADVGAIFLGDISTEYTLGAHSGDSDGTLHSTSVFLKENGGSGTIQHVDLSI
jgi:hypothetical protein